MYKAKESAERLAAVKDKHRALGDLGTTAVASNRYYYRNITKSKRTNMTNSRQEGRAN